MIDLKHGDCLELMKTIPDGSIDLILTVPPYGTTACKWDSVIDFDLMWEQLKRVIKSNGAIVLFGSEPFSSALRMSNIKQYKYDWVWDKVFAGNFVQAKNQPLKDFENVMVFSKNGGKVNYYPIMTKRDKPIAKGSNKQSTAIPIAITEASIKFSKEKKTYDYKYPTSNSLRFSGRTDRGFHPTQKPVPLLEYLIKTYTLENETVLDFTMGSGSTGVACVNINRNFIGIERDDKYFEIATKRIEEAKEKQEFENLLGVE